MEIEIVNNFKKEVKNLKPKKIMNIACGVNLKPDFLKEVNANFYGIDIDDHVIGDRVKRCDVDRDLIPFNDGFFDLAICIYGLEHFKTEKVFGEVSRILRKNGKFIIITTNSSNPSFVIAKFLGLRKYYLQSRGVGEEYSAYYKLSPMSLIRNLKRTSFEIEDIRGFSYISDYVGLFFKKFSKIVKTIENILYYFFPMAKPTLYISATKVR